VNERSVTHNTFVIERTYNATPERVFAAWSDPALKRRWFSGSDEAGPGYELDFRVDGRERNLGGPPGGPVYTYEARYREIVPGERIVFTYDMYLDEPLMSVSVVTVELRAEGAGTGLTFTEHCAHLDGGDTPQQRKHGTEELLDKLQEMLKDELQTR
jgi:uncharacterized protein YndB with AHSA1/START domain